MEGLAEGFAAQNGFRGSLGFDAVVDEHHLIGIPGKQGKVVGDHEDGHALVAEAADAVGGGRGQGVQGIKGIGGKRVAAFKRVETAFEV